MIRYGTWHFARFSSNRVKAWKFFAGIFGAFFKQINALQEKKRGKSLYLAHTYIDSCWTKHELTWYYRDCPQLWLWHLGMQQHLELSPMLIVKRKHQKINVRISIFILEGTVKMNLTKQSINVPARQISAHLYLINRLVPFPALEALLLSKEPILHLGILRKDQCLLPPPSTKGKGSPPIP